MRARYENFRPISEEKGSVSYISSVEISCNSRAALLYFFI